MNVIFCRPELTMEDVGDAICFFNECHTILDKYIYNLRTIGSYELIRQIMLENADKDDRIPLLYKTNTDLNNSLYHIPGNLYNVYSIDVSNMTVTDTLSTIDKIFYDIYKIS